MVIPSIFDDPTLPKEFICDELQDDLYLSSKPIKQYDSIKIIATMYEIYNLNRKVIQGESARHVHAFDLRIVSRYAKLCCLEVFKQVKYTKHKNKKIVLKIEGHIALKGRLTTKIDPITELSYYCSEEDIRCVSSLEFYIRGYAYDELYHGVTPL